ncbi:methyltransferase domain-containing protein [Parashewanella curva]|uniref:Ribosomal RNA large subunit methyltransferase G n=1 Tax=Parashewanella curva TaxID=2338552 RepID=A0A3L8PXH4_9GAMM|nr:methyltransferase [Parashewanella curva]RLV59158.1 methyltransferase domain-containing protein [Parashewanella curva]
MHLALTDRTLSLSLHRYPQFANANLQAWDAADEYMLKQLFEADEVFNKVAIINDSFGALTCAIAQQAPELPLLIETDNKTSQLGTLSNLKVNELSDNKIDWINSRSPLPDDIDLVLMKLPKNLNYFAHQLSRLSRSLKQGTKVLIAAKAKSINKSVIELIKQQLGDATASLAWKKCRVITCISDGSTRDEPKLTQWSIPEYQLKLNNFSNVFAANKLDIGARALLQFFPQGDYKQIIDLGCGNGVLGLRAAQVFPDANIHFVDDSEMAVASAQQNWQLNGLNTENGHFYWDDCLTDLSDEIKPDLIICNPPFHQGEAITDHIAWQMFLDAKRKLADGGTLHIVGNRHLGYHIKLKRLFGNCKTMGSNGKFVVLQAIKN